MVKLGVELAGMDLRLDYLQYQEKLCLKLLVLFQPLNVPSQFLDEPRIF